MNPKGFLTKIVHYYENKKWEDVINTAFDNKDLIIDNFKTYINNIKSGQNKPVEILATFSDTLYNSYATKVNNNDDNIFTPLIRFVILGLVEQFHKIKLKEVDELKTPMTKITYITTVADDLNKTKLFVLYLMVYYMESEIRNITFDSLLNKRPHVGIDYEFNNRIIALMQINFENVADINLETNSYIWLVNPGEFDDEVNNLLITYLMTNQKIYKILHGPDSLDIPYMYDIMFKGDKETILKFTKKILDTRFLCEYFRISIGKDKKCSIYNALEYFETITEEKFNNLEEVHESMGPVQDINWNIHKMSSFHTKYALYDVLFLQHFLLDIYKKINKETPQYVNSYKFVNSIIRFTFLERREVTDIIETAKNIINPINNYLIKYRNKNITLINIYNEVIENFKISEEDIDINFLLSVGYFKKTLSVLFKYVVYFIVKDNYDVYIKKNIKMEEKLSMDIIYKKMKENKFLKMTYLINLFQNEAKKKILTLYI